MNTPLVDIYVPADDGKSQNGDSTAKSGQESVKEKKPKKALKFSKQEISEFIPTQPIDDGSANYKPQQHQNYQ
jgi:hypothetical protein